MPVDPTPESFGRFMSEDDGKPVVMLNMLRFKPDGGRELYERYARETAPFLAGVGGEIVYAGDCSSLLVGPEGHGWDMIALARYPSRAAFAEMVTNPGYQAITRLRTEALEEAVLHATSQLELPDG